MSGEVDRKCIRDITFKSTKVPKTTTIFSAEGKKLTAYFNTSVHGEKGFNVVIQVTYLNGLQATSNQSLGKLI